LPIAAATLFSIAALPAAALAQQQLQKLDPVRVTVLSDAARADSLESAAAEYRLTALRDFRKIARMYEESAALRADGDEKRLASLQRAANIRYGRGDRRRAAANMEQAAREAAARGDVVNAARSYTDAAFIAAELNQPARAAALTQSAALLTESPLLTPAQRLELRARLPQRGEVAVADHP
jgi:hypothetical protein